MLLEIGLLKRKKQTNKHKTKNKNKKQNNGEINRSNRSFNMPPPPATPRAFDFFENYCPNSPLPGPKCRSNDPHWSPFRRSNAPHPGDISQAPK